MPTPPPLTDALPCVQISGLEYRIQASTFRLNVNNCQIARQEKVAIIGPSGCGKTTLLALISGQLLPASGIIQVLGQPLTQMSEPAREQFRLAHIGIIFQEFRLIEYLTVRENIALRSTLRGEPLTAPQKQEIGEIAEHLGLQSLLTRYPQQLSHGERQRTAIGRAMFGSPALILADEPTGNLDPHTAQETLQYLFAVVERIQATLLLVTHDHSLLPHFDRQIDLQQLRQNSPLQCSPLE